MVNNMLTDVKGNSELEQFKSHLIVSKFIENLCSDIKVELLKFGLKTFEELVDKVIHIENALNHKEFDFNNICAVPSTSIDSSLFNSILEQQNTQSKQIEQLTLTIQKLKEEKLACQICEKKIIQPKIVGIFWELKTIFQSLTCTPILPTSKVM